MSTPRNPFIRDALALLKVHPAGMTAARLAANSGVFAPDFVVRLRQHVTLYTNKGSGPNSPCLYSTTHHSGWHPAGRASVRKSSPTPRTDATPATVADLTMLAAKLEQERAALWAEVVQLRAKVKLARSLLS